MSAPESESIAAQSVAPPTPPRTPPAPPSGGGYPSYNSPMLHDDPVARGLGNGALVAAIFGLFIPILGCSLALVLGYISMRRSKKSGSPRSTAAFVAVILGWIGVALSVIMATVVIVIASLYWTTAITTAVNGV